MHVQQITWTTQAGWSRFADEPKNVSLVFYFGNREMLACAGRYRELREMFPTAHIVGCSTGGQINNNDVSDDEIVAAVICFDSTGLQLVRRDIAETSQSRSCGEAIGRVLSRED